MYFVAGVLIGLTLAHGCAAPQLFSKRMYQWISQGYERARSALQIDDVATGNDVHDQLHRVGTGSFINVDNG